MHRAGTRRVHSLIAPPTAPRPRLHGLDRRWGLVQLKAEAYKAEDRECKSTHHIPVGARGVRGAWRLFVRKLRGPEPVRRRLLGR